MKTWSISEILSAGFPQLKHAWLPMLAGIIILMLVGAVAGVLEATGAIAAAFVALVLRLAVYYLQLGYLRMALQAVDGDKPQVSSLFTTPFMRYLRVLGAYIGIVLLILVPAFSAGMAVGGALQVSQPLASLLGLLAVVLGLGCLYVLVRFSFLAYIFADSDISLGDGFSLAWQTTGGQVLKLIALLLSLLLGLAPAALLIIGLSTALGLPGLYVALPLGLAYLALWSIYSALCLASVYRRLVQH